MTRRWVIAGGGTGGHVTPALALGEAIAERGDRVLFVGSAHGLETRLVPQAGFELVALPSRQVMGRGPAGRVRGVAAILGSVARARRAIARLGADVVIAVGGYAAMPAVLAAAWGRTPLALLEPNAIPGRVNRIGARFARRVFTAFDETLPLLRPRRGGRALCTGVPLRRALVEAFSSTPERGEPAPPFHLLVFGGSQGARQLNEAMGEAAAELARRFPDGALEVFHQSGEADRERVAEAYAKAGLPAQVVAFEPDMPARYRWAHLAVCRAGALTVAELALAGLPALLVPYPYAADEHQAANARGLEHAGAARALDAKALRGAHLVSAASELFADPPALAAMSRAARGQARPEAAAHILEECAAMLRDASSARGA
jgi:UDP-N-acetylglucosamine--N-acetylmuramyl-(pentapeptide) pyrophosphoryl-undecaprenol N-acetylglucosamine transferase